MSGNDRTCGPAELARLCGVSTDLLRHYERKSLIEKPHRTAAGYRRYPRTAVARVELIQRALAIGFSLDDLARVLKERDRGGAPCRHVHALVGSRLADLDRRLKEMSALRRELRTLLRDWDERLARTPAGTRAHLLDTLAGRPALDKRRARTPFR